MRCSALLNILITFTFIVNAAKIPTLCLMECMVTDFGILKKNIDIQDTTNIICQNKKYKKTVITCLENKCETPGLTRYNTNKFATMCSNSYKIKDNNGISLGSKSSNHMDQKQFVGSKRLSFTGGDKNLRNRENHSNL